jgi:hypothetical protein
MVSAAEQEHKYHHRARIHIDRHLYESANPATGAALYALGNIAAGLELYRELSANRKSELSIPVAALDQE